MFPRDPDTFEFIKEIELYLGIPHQDINKISDTELSEYINQLSMRLHKVSSVYS